MLAKLHAAIHVLADQHGLPTTAHGPDAAALPIELQPGEYADALAPRHGHAPPRGP